MKNCVVFCSGGGSNFQSILDAVISKTLKLNITALIASKDGIGAIERAKRHGIPCYVFDKTSFSSLQEMYGEIEILLKKLNTDIIVLAGYLTILTPEFVRSYKNRIINIHPSLLPKFGGGGFYGLRVHEAVIAAGETESGCTVHFVDEGTDTGKIIAQSKVAVLPNDTAETLQQRVLKQEHILLPQTLAMLVDKGEI